MNINIAPEFESFVNAKLESGTYCSASELVGDALRLLAERDEFHSMRIKKLNQEIQIGLDQAENGEIITAEESKNKMTAFKLQFSNNPNS